MTLEVKRLDAETWEAYVDGAQVGQYTNATAARAAARRRVPGSRLLQLAGRVTWSVVNDPGVDFVPAGWRARV